MTSLRAIARIILQPLFIGLLAAIIVRVTVLQAYSIPSDSMRPTLERGDHILVTPVAWGREVRRGDVIVFRNPGVGPGFFVKRVIALEGEHLEIRDGRVRIEGRVLEEPYLEHAPTDGSLAEIVPAGHFFVLGDLRSDSIDSRVWGALPEENVVGRARMIFWSAGGVAASSASAQSSDPAPGHYRGPRWNRILRPVR